MSKLETLRGKIGELEASLLNVCDEIEKLSSSDISDVSVSQKKISDKLTEKTSLELLITNQRKKLQKLELFEKFETECQVYRGFVIEEISVRKSALATIENAVQLFDNLKLCYEKLNKLYERTKKLPDFSDKIFSERISSVLLDFQGIESSDLKKLEDSWLQRNKQINAFQNKQESEIINDLRVKYFPEGVLNE